MSKRTLYQALSTLRTIMNIYGVNWKAEKNVFWKILKWLAAVIFTYYYVSETGGYIVQKIFTVVQPQLRIPRLELYLCFEITSWLVNTLSYVSCLVQWKQWEDLAQLTKTCWMTDDQYRGFKSSLRLILFAPLVIYLVHSVYYCCQTSEFSLTLMLKNYEILMPIFTHIVPYLFLTLMSLYICSVAFYVKITWNELIEESKVCKSDIRRDKITARLFTVYYRLERLIRRVDNVGSFIMFVSRATAALSVSLVFYEYKICFEADQGLVYILLSIGKTNVLVFNAILLVFYLRMATSINKLVPSIGRVMADLAALRDTRMPMNLTAQVELNHLIQLHHLVIDKGQLTLSRDPISGQTLFSLCAEAMDNINCINKHFEH